WPRPLSFFFLGIAHPASAADTFGSPTGQSPSSAAHLSSRFPFPLFSPFSLPDHSPVCRTIPCPFPCPNKSSLSESCTTAHRQGIDSAVRAFPRLTRNCSN
ncbi:hypothetical protein BC940DRAFT_363022, partial [Gongronella butleri]